MLWGIINTGLMACGIGAYALVLQNGIALNESVALVMPFLTIVILTLVISKSWTTGLLQAVRTFFIPFCGFSLVLSFFSLSYLLIGMISGTLNLNAVIMPYLQSGVEAIFYCFAVMAAGLGGILFVVQLQKTPVYALSGALIASGFLIYLHHSFYLGIIVLILLVNYLLLKREYKLIESGIIPDPVKREYKIIDTEYLYLFTSPEGSVFKNLISDDVRLDVFFPKPSFDWKPRDSFAVGLTPFSYEHAIQDKDHFTYDDFFNSFDASPSIKQEFLDKDRLLVAEYQTLLTIFKTEGYTRKVRQHQVRLDEALRHYYESLLRAKPRLSLAYQKIGLATGPLDWFMGTIRGIKTDFGRY